MWDVRQQDDPVALMQPKEGESRRDCWAVAFGTFYTIRSLQISTLCASRT